VHGMHSGAAKFGGCPGLNMLAYGPISLPQAPTLPPTMPQALHAAGHMLDSVRCWSTVMADGTFALQLPLLRAIAAPQFIPTRARTPSGSLVQPTSTGWEGAGEGGEGQLKPKGTQNPAASHHCEGGWHDCGGPPG
jgi:hypothetical protein